MQNQVARTALVAAALIGTFGLVLFGRFVWTTNHEGHDNPVIRGELLTIYCTPDLIEFAKKHDVIATNDELLRPIEQEGLSECWMVSVDRVHQQDGTIIDGPMIVYPGKVVYFFEIYRALLLTIAGNPPDEPHAMARIVIIPQHLVNKKPNEALPELLEL